MNYISVENISKSYGERVLFSGISFGINKDQKIAFIAKNGTGKTSLLHILTGQDTPDEGQVITRNGIRIAFLSQHPRLNPEITVEETIFASGHPLLKIIRRYEKALENPGNTRAYQEAFEQMERHQAWDVETRYRQILYRLQLNNLDQKVATLSGGQKKRLALAVILIQTPDVFILDEPTNHLDTDMITWLENYFIKENITLFMVTHDRYFLERVCDEIVELDHGKLYQYKGNYSYYLEKKQARLEAENASVEKAKNIYNRELEWMQRQPKARTSKSKARIDDFSLIKEKAHRRRKDHRVQLEINMERLGSKIVEFHNVSKAFNGQPVLHKFSYTFKKGERIGIIGKNGTGKTTFLNLLTRTLVPDAGKIVVGDTVKFGYYTQAGIRPKPGQKVIEVIREFGEYIPLTKGRQISAAQLLERFLFDRKQQYDYVEKLSGGELKRLYLCTVLIRNPNFLMLDEPTNDLDIVTLNVLEDFLLDFPGCLIAVSHDRYFIDKIADHLFVFRRNGRVEDFPGNYSDFTEWEERAETPPAAGDKPQKTPKKDPGNPLEPAERKEYKRLERSIAALEAEKTAIEARFTEGDLSAEAINEQAKKLQGIIEELEEKTERWFELASKFET